MGGSDGLNDLRVVKAQRIHCHGLHHAGWESEDQLLVLGKLWEHPFAASASTPPKTRGWKNECSGKWVTWEVMAEGMCCFHAPLCFLLFLRRRWLLLIFANATLCVAQISIR